MHEGADLSSRKAGCYSCYVCYTPPHYDSGRSSCSKCSRARSPNSGWLCPPLWLCSARRLPICGSAFRVRCLERKHRRPNRCGWHVSYRRFVLSQVPATVATPATLRSVNHTASDTSRRSPEQPAAPTASSGHAIRGIQTDPFRCFVCNHAFIEGESIIAVLSDVPGERFWIHHGCHDAHIRRCAAERSGSPG